jgi:phage gpG-like protein
MSGVRLQYKFDDTKVKELLNRLSRFQSRAMFDEIGGYLDSTVGDRFKQGRDPEGNTWEPSVRALALETGGTTPEGNTWEPSVRALETGGTTLVDHGNLRDSITPNVFADGSGVEHGSNMIYAAIHQFGGKAGRNRAVTLPARPFIGISPDDESQINAIVEDHIQRALQ